VYGRAYSESVWDVPGHIRCSLRTSEPLLPALLQDMDALSFVYENLIFWGKKISKIKGVQNELVATATSRNSHYSFLLSLLISVAKPWPTGPQGQLPVGPPWAFFLPAPPTQRLSGREDFCTRRRFSLGLVNDQGEQKQCPHSQTGGRRGVFLFPL